MSKGQISWHVRLWPGTWPAASNGTKVVLGRLPTAQKAQLRFRRTDTTENLPKVGVSRADQGVWPLFADSGVLPKISAKTTKMLQFLASSAHESPRKFHERSTKAHERSTKAHERSTKGPRKVHERSTKGPRKVHERFHERSTFWAPNWLDFAASKAKSMQNLLCGTFSALLAAKRRNFGI